MPYSKKTDLPDVVKNALPAEAQDIWMGAFNASTEGGKSEGEAAVSAWGSVKRAGWKKPEKEGDKWIKAAEVALAITFNAGQETFTFAEEMSFEQIREKICAVINKDRSEIELGRLWVDQTFTNYAIIEDYRHNKYYRVAYSINESDEVELGTIQEVQKKTIYEPVPANNPLTASEKVRFSGLVSLEEVQIGEQVTTTDIEILRTGSWNHPEYGKFTVKEADLDQFISNFASNVRGVDLAIDQAHDPDKGAAGWFKKLFKQETEDHGTALFATIEWTAWGKELVENKIFRYISPEFAFKYKDDETGKTTKNVLFGAALTNRPFIKGMQPVLLSEALAARVRADEIDVLNSRMFCAEGDRQKTPKGGSEMKLEELRTTLALAEDAGEDAIKAALESLKSQAEQGKVSLTEVSKQLGLSEEAGQEEVLQAIKALGEKAEKAGDKESEVAALKEENKKLSGRVETLEQKNRELDWEKLSTKKLAEGRMTPAQAAKFKERYMKDPEGTKEIIDLLEPVVDLKEHGSSRSTEGSSLKVFNEKVNAKLKENDGMTYVEAAAQVEQEDPALFAEADRERRGK